MLSDDETTHLEQALYVPALVRAGETDSLRNRTVAANDYWLFLRAGGGSDAAAIDALTRGLRACDVRRSPDPPA